MKWLSAVILLSTLSLYGCGSSENPDAPVSTAPHETAWVTYHREDIVSSKSVTVNDSASQPAGDGILVTEHVTRCRVCHGAGLTGAKTGAAGPACLDCHVLDPVKYPVMCYSCHGAYPVVPPQQWYSTNRATRPGLPLGSSLINRVNTGSIHIKHDAVKGITLDNCSVCHGGPNYIGEIHHSKVMIENNMGCLGPLPKGCHTFGFSRSSGFKLVTPDCGFCHK